MQEIYQKAIVSAVLLSTVFLQLGKQVHGGECVDVTTPQTRTFPTLLNLQANRVSFNTASSNFAGNYITIEEPLKNIGRNSFISYSSKYIIKIFLSNHQIKQIEEGAFISLECLMTLDLHKNAISRITRDTFEGLVILQEFNLAENSIKEIPDHVFSLMPRMKNLNLSRNSIRVLYRDSFYGLFLLEQLDLSYNHLHPFAPEILRHFKLLTNFQLGSNQIDRVEFERWQLPKLRTFNLSNNILVSFDTSYDFTFGATLKELYLNQNYLTQLNPYGLRKHFPNLGLIDINDNPWACPHLSPLVMTLNDTRVLFNGSSRDDGPNINNIACNRSLEVYNKNKVLDLEDTELPTKASTISPKPSTALDLQLEKAIAINSQILEGIKRTNTLIALLFAIVIIFILVDISIRSDALNCILCIRKRCSRGSSRDLVNGGNENIENSCLLQDRPQ